MPVSLRADFDADALRRKRHEASTNLKDTDRAGSWSGLTIGSVESAGKIPHWRQHFLNFLPLPHGPGIVPADALERVNK